MHHEILHEFLTESRDQLSRIEAALAALADAVPGESAAAEPGAEAGRLLHAMRDTCGFLGFRHLAALTHAAGNVAPTALRRTPPEPPTMDLLREAVAEVHRLLQCIESDGDEPAAGPADLIARLSRPADAPRKPSSPEPVHRDDPVAAGASTINGPTAVRSSVEAAGHPDKASLAGLAEDFARIRERLWQQAGGTAQADWVPVLSELDRIGDDLERLVKTPTGCHGPERHSQQAVGKAGADVLPAVISITRTGTARETAAGPPRVLVIDDSLFFRLLVGTALERDGWQVTAADGGVDGAALIEAGGEFDAVVSDIEMPGMDGLEFARWFRTRPGSATVPLIALSSSADEGQVLQAGFDRLLAKFHAGRLIDALDALHHRHRPHCRRAA